MLTLLSPSPSPFPSPFSAAAYPGPGEPWTLALAEEFLRAHEPAVTAAFLRVQGEMAEAHPGAEQFLARYDVRSLLRAYPTRTHLDAQLVAMVQVRTALGRIVSATIHVPWGSPGVVVRGWPDRR